MRKIIAVALLLLATPAAAQQSDPQQAIASTIGQLVIQNANLAAQRDMLQKQVTDLQAKVKELQEEKKPKASDAPKP